MDYTEARAYIRSKRISGQKLGTENITRLLDKLGNPQRNLKVLHITGTNGKGSTSTMLSYILAEAGYKTGLHLSPSLEKFEERIQINNELISEETLAQLATIIKPAVDAIIDEGFQSPKEFDIIVATALMYFAQENVDFAVVEVGMGGRLDATNVFDKPEVAIFTTIGLDHIRALGDTVEKIAFEKSGIIKPGGDVVIYPLLSGGAREVIREQASLKEAKVHQGNIADISLLSSSPAGQVISYSKKGSMLGLDEFELALLGQHQVFNVLNVLEVCEVLASKGYNLPSSSIKAALRKARYTGRFEVMHSNPYIVLDGSHNIEGISSFVDNINRYFAGKKAILFFGMLSDKQFGESIDKFSTVVEKVYTLTPDDRRAIPAAEMANLISTAHPDIVATPLESFSQIGDLIDLNDKEALYAFCGSLHVVGPARTELVQIIGENKTQ
ncbi:MAG: bifunctional folylpolyglutamate synthase/dihydrofolate synthase [Eubacteriaceae bacterium]|nr:bifunctional folylpolyglutamate synthase/dihydrofolate synthase [Eubacteriaceae bacterium]